jgi:hypothetical protein
MGFVNYTIATGGGQDGDPPLPNYRRTVYQSAKGYEYFRYTKKAAQVRPRQEQRETVERELVYQAVPYKMPRRARKPKAPLKLTAEEKRLYDIVMKEKNAIRRTAYAAKAPKPCKGDKVRAGKQGNKGRKLFRCVKPKKPRKVRAKKAAANVDKFLAALGNF